MVIAAPLCGCGCGCLTGWSTRPRPRDGYREGDPLRFCASHMAAESRAVPVNPPPVNPLGRGASGVPTAVLRAALEASGESAAVVARRLGWLHRRRGAESVADGSRVRRTLGMLPAEGGRYRQRVDRRTARRFAEAMGLAPREIGL